MIIVRYLMVKLDLLAYFKHQFLQWYSVTVPMKEPSGMLGKLYIISCKMDKGVIHTV